MIPGNVPVPCPSPAGFGSLWGRSCPIPVPLSPCPLCVPCVSPQPQAGVPDVQLWLLRGQLRVASARVAATDVLHCPRACGPLCGRILTLFLVRAPGVPLCPYMSPSVPTCLLCPCSMSPLYSHLISSKSTPSLLCVAPRPLPVPCTPPHVPSLSPPHPPSVASMPSHVPSMFPPSLLCVPSCPLPVLRHVPTPR